MPKNKFLYVHKIIRFDDVSSRRAQRSDDKFELIRGLWDRWSELLPKFYNPYECATIDEQLLGFHGRCPFRQYMPSKPERYGIKFWMMACAESYYVWKIQPYLGKAPGAKPEVKQGERVVLDLVDGLKGHNITMDNFFTSFDLGQKLLEKNLTMVGTVRKNKKFIPPELLKCKKVPLYQSTFAFTDNTTLVSYLSRKNKCTILQSTMHHSADTGPEPKSLPEIVEYYNSTKGGVDTVDKMVSCFSCKRKCNRWPMAVFSNIIDISALNGYIMYSEINPNWFQGKNWKRKAYLHELGLSLAKNYMQNRSRKTKSTASNAVLSSLSQN